MTAVTFPLRPPRLAFAICGRRWQNDVHEIKYSVCSVCVGEGRVSFLTVFFWKALSLCSPYPLPTTTLPPVLEFNMAATREKNKKTKTRTKQNKDALAENWLVDFLFLYYVYLPLSLFFCPIVPRSSSRVRHRLSIVPTYYNTTESTDWCQQPLVLRQGYEFVSTHDG